MKLVTAALLFLVSLLFVHASIARELFMPCSPACVQATQINDHWLLSFTDDDGNLIKVEEIDVPTSFPLDMYLADNNGGGDVFGASKRVVGSDDIYLASMSTIPPPPVGGEGSVSRDTHGPGVQGGQSGTFVVTIVYTFVNFNLVNVNTIVVFTPDPPPVPRPNQQQ